MFETLWHYFPKKSIIGLIVGAAIYGGFAVDTAGDHVSREEARQLKEAGAELFIQALTWWPRCSQPTSQSSTRVESLVNARAEGLRIAGYFLVDPHSTGRQAVDRARDGMPLDVWEDLEFVALDYEIPAECRPQYNVSYFTVLEALQRLDELGKPAVIYTNYDNWVSVLNNPTRPEGTLLWNAAWDGDQDFDFPNSRYGGWQDDEVILEQYNGGTQKGGVYVDLNTIRYQPVEPVPPTPVAEHYWDGTFWQFPNNTAYSPTNIVWPWWQNGRPEWGSCLSWGGRLNANVPVAVHHSTPLFNWIDRYWTVAPAC